MKNTILGVLFFFTLYSCQKQSQKIEEPNTEALRSQVKPTEVVTARARFGTFEYRINASGQLASANELKITFQGSGYLEKLNIKNGQEVRAGQVLAELQNTNEKFALEKAKLALEKALIQYRSDSLGRTRITEEAIQTLQLASGLKDARLNLREAQLNLEKTLVKAPISGVIAGLEEKQGNIISAGKDLCVVYTPNQMVLTANILESDYGSIKLGLKADIYPLAFPDKLYEGTLTEINPKVDEKGMVEVKLLLSDAQGLLPGMNAQAVIRAPQSESVLVPREAVVIKSGRPVVFTMVDGLAQWKYVEVGKDNGVDIEITSGINSGDEVIITNNIQLAHEARVVKAQMNGQTN
jgi:RND family efflux transporter MFP subunit